MIAVVVAVVTIAAVIEASANEAIISYLSDRNLTVT